MKAFTISATLALLVATVCSAPTSSNSEKRQSAEFLITFNGADPDAFFTQSFPIDNDEYPITNVLSVTSITNGSPATCIFTGIDGSVTTVFGGETVPVGPPQTQVSGFCEAHS